MRNKNAAKYVAYSSLFYFFIKAVPTLAQKSPIVEIFLALELLGTLLLLCGIWQEIQLLMIPYLMHQASFLFAVCIVINSVEIGIWLLELASTRQVYNPKDYLLMERSIAFVMYPEVFNETYVFKGLPKVRTWPTGNAEDKIWVLVFIFFLSASLAVSIYFFRIIINFYRFLKSITILLDNQKVIYNGQSEPEHDVIVPHRK